MQVRLDAQREAELVVEVFRGLVFRQVFQRAFAVHVTAAALVGAVAEVLVGPLSAGVASADTVPYLVRFTLRALGADDAAHS